MSQFRGNTGTLIVIVVRARALPNKRKLEKQNPYCLLRIANLTDKTKADLRGGQVPRWDQEFRFHMSPEITPVLKLSVLDETKKAPTLIAEAEVDVTPAFYASVKDGYDKWHTLTSGDGREAGEIYLEMTFYPASSSTTFSSSGRKMGSSIGSSMGSSAGSNMSAASRRRQLPPIPGQEQQEAVIAADPYAIPPPLPRNTGATRASSPPLASPPTHPSQQQLFHQSMNISQMSVHTLPDIPHQHKAIEEPRTSASSPQRSTPPLREFPDLASYDSASLAESHDRVSSSNAFDELEREVQLNYNGPAQRHGRARPTPPPVPSHSVGSLKSSSSSYTSLAPPRKEQPTLSETIYSIIEPQHSNSSRSARSPTRKPPTGFYKSGSSSPKRLDLSSIPYDANTISASSTTPTRHHSPEKFGESLHTRDASDVLLPSHNAPTPYEVFVSNAGSSTGSAGSMGSSGGRSRMSPTRFKSSLPPTPPKK
ncbi:CYFA0S01e13498g1_1 [Cyberlindnera fabianii]|uniref:CYFA0S01e13498g1_1 n=1 Tax=Cyberlindnera fabianii TaxID=36022 RepID=A0A061AKF5_CYBFA|nr:CYFA0S01e13498g1_1 [Cyberlindnera fabianii]